MSHMCMPGSALKFSSQISQSSLENEGIGGEG